MHYDVLLAPIVTGEHWYLAAFFIDTKIVIVVDSLHSRIPSIFRTLKASVESIIHIQFVLRNENHNITLQLNGYDCGVNAFRNAEEICFHGKCKLFVPYYPEAERARAREILRKLKDREIGDEWVPPVRNSTDFINLNMPSNDVEEILVVEENDSDVEIIESNPVQDNTVTTVLKQNKNDCNAETKKDENICDLSLGCLNEPIDNMCFNDSMEIDEEQKLLSTEEEARMKKELSETVAAYCKRKKIKNDAKGKNSYNQFMKNIKEKLAQNEKFKEYKQNCQITTVNDDLIDDNQDRTIMSVEEEAKLKNEANETYAEFCRRLKISKAKSKNKYNSAIKSAQQKLAENERIKQCKKEKRLMETEEEKNLRLQQVANSMQKLRDNETAEEKQDRLKKVAYSMQKLRDNESEEDKDVRLQNDAKLKQMKRENETEEETSQRLINDKNQKAINRTIVRLEKLEKLKKEREERIENLKKALPFLVRKGAEYKKVEPFKLGKRDTVCNGCGAKHYRTEKVQKDGSFTSCCKQGRIKMDASVADYPQNLKNLMKKIMKMKNI